MKCIDCLALHYPPGDRLHVFCSNEIFKIPLSINEPGLQLNNECPQYEDEDTEEKI